MALHLFLHYASMRTIGPMMAVPSCRSSSVAPHDNLCLSFLGHHGTFFRQNVKQATSPRPNVFCVHGADMRVCSCGASWSGNNASILSHADKSQHKVRRHMSRFMWLMLFVIGVLVGVIVALIRYFAGAWGSPSFRSPWRNRNSGQHSGLVDLCECREVD